MSTSLSLWTTDAQAVFEEIEHTHGAIGGRQRGRRFLTRQTNYAYVTALAAQFQLYCRAVHTEVTQLLATGVGDPALSRVLEGRLIEGRQIDRGNANVPNLGSDFGRLGFRFWHEVNGRRARNPRRRDLLEELIDWRNAIAHGDIDRKRAKGELTPPEVHLAHCRRWRSSLGQLVFSIDDVLATQCENLGLPRPW